MMAKMSYGIKLVVVAALVLCVQVLPVRAAWDAEVMGVPDGDSLKVKRNGKVYKVRIYGIDCPEYGQSEWRLARDFTRRLTAGRVVSVEPMDKDRYGRVVALVYSDGQLVNRELVRNGLAWMYPRYCTSQPLCGEMKGLEASARRQHIGLWQDPAAMPPWQWKRLNKGEDNRSRKNNRGYRW